MTVSPIDQRFKRKSLDIFKRDEDCYDVTDGKTRVAALRADFDTDPANSERTVKPGTWTIRWEFTDGIADGHYHNGRRIDPPEAIANLHFGTVHEAYAFFISQVLL